MFSLTTRYGTNQKRIGFGVNSQLKVYKSEQKLEVCNQQAATAYQ